jgi:hypothetical protein
MNLVIRQRRTTKFIAHCNNQIRWGIDVERLTAIALH